MPCYFAMLKRVFLSQWLVRPSFLRFYIKEGAFSSFFRTRLIHPVPIEDEITFDSPSAVTSALSKIFIHRFFSFAELRLCISVFFFF